MLLENQLLQPTVGKEYLLEALFHPDDRSGGSQRSSSPSPLVLDGETEAPNGASNGPQTSC